jgi:hypothetical protein
MEMVGKMDQPLELRVQEYLGYGETAGLMLYMLGLFHCRVKYYS